MRDWRGEIDLLALEEDILIQMSSKELRRRSKLDEVRGFIRTMNKLHRDLGLPEAYCGAEGQFLGRQPAVNSTTLAARNSSELSRAPSQGVGQE